MKPMGNFQASTNAVNIDPLFGLVPSTCLKKPPRGTPWRLYTLPDDFAGGSGERPARFFQRSCSKLAVRCITRRTSRRKWSSEHRALRGRLRLAVTGIRRSPNARSAAPCLSCTYSSARRSDRQWSNSGAVSYPLPHWYSDRLSRDHRSSSGKGSKLTASIAPAI
jgi:hypothetical protein